MLNKTLHVNEHTATAGNGRPAATIVSAILSDWPWASARLWLLSCTMKHSPVSIGLRTHCTQAAWAAATASACHVYSKNNCWMAQASLGSRVNSKVCLGTQTGPKTDKPHPHDVDICPGTHACWRLVCLRLCGCPRASVTMRTYPAFLSCLLHHALLFFRMHELARVSILAPALGLPVVARQVLFLCRDSTRACTCPRDSGRCRMLQQPP